MGGFDSKEPVTAEQLTYLKILNYDGSPPKTKGEASLLIADLKYNWKYKSPSEVQLLYLSTLGYSGNPPKTRGEASNLISKLKTEKTEMQQAFTIRDIPLVIYGDTWSEENPFADIHEHSEDFHKAKEWRDSLDN